MLLIVGEQPQTYNRAGATLASSIRQIGAGRCPSRCILVPFCIGRPRRTPRRSTSLSSFGARYWLTSYPQPFGWVGPKTEQHGEPMSSYRWGRPKACIRPPPGERRSGFRFFAEPALRGSFGDEGSVGRSP